MLSFINAEALPSTYGGQFKMPDEPLGEALYQYLCIFEDEYEGIKIVKLKLKLIKVLSIFTRSLIKFFYLITDASDLGYINKK